MRLCTKLEFSPASTSSARSLCSAALTLSVVRLANTLSQLLGRRLRGLGAAALTVFAASAL